MVSMLVIHHFAYHGAIKDMSWYQMISLFSQDWYVYRLE